MKTLLTSLFVLLSFSAFAQKHDYVWIFGYDGDSDHPQFEATNLDFKTFPPQIIPSNRPYDVSGVTSSICDKDGNLLAFTNGFTIFNREEKIMVNGDSINPGWYFENYYERGTPHWYDSFFLPVPNRENKYYIFHFGAHDVLDANYAYHKLYYSLIDFSKQNGLGEVTEKNKLLIEGAFEPASACKHGNGRDWWVLFPSNISMSIEKHRFLVTPNSISKISTQQIGENNNEKIFGGTRNAFSPDGNTYVQMDGFLGVLVYDFNRCNGELKNYRRLKFDHIEDRLLGTFEFSPNGRFVYFNTKVTLMQLDLWQDTLDWSAVDTVATYDGFIDWGVSTSFHALQLGPEGKIYMSCTTASPYLHIIHNPNEKGLACNVEQHGLKLAGRHLFSIPYFPNFRLGALENSPCDTLKTTKTNELISASNIKVFPNPTADNFTVEFVAPMTDDVELALFDIAGRRMKKVLLGKGMQREEVVISHLPKGVYFYEIGVEGQVLKTGKLIKI